MSRTNVKLMVGRTDREIEGRTRWMENRTGLMYFPYSTLVHRTEGLITALFLDWSFSFSIINKSFLIVLNIAPTSTQIITYYTAFETEVIVNKFELNEKL
jgi:hypothetical protein